MSIKFSAYTGGFYDTDIHTVIPDDAVGITNEYHATLMQGQTNGQEIKADKNGFPVLAERVMTQEQLIKSRIASLESKQTPRRLREAALGLDNGWLKNLESEIAALRSQLS